MSLRLSVHLNEPFECTRRSTRLFEGSATILTVALHKPEPNLNRLSAVFIARQLSENLKVIQFLRPSEFGEL